MIYRPDACGLDCQTTLSPPAGRDAMGRAAKIVHHRCCQTHDGALHVQTFRSEQVSQLAWPSSSSIATAHSLLRATTPSSSISGATASGPGNGEKRRVFGPP